MAEARYEGNDEDLHLERLLAIIGKPASERHSHTVWNSHQEHTQCDNLSRTPTQEPDRQQSMSMHNKDPIEKECSAYQEKCEEAKPEPTDPKRKQVDPEESKEFACHICSKSYSRIYPLQDHIAAEHEGKRSICHICGFTTKWPVNLTTHLRKIHNVGEEPLKKEMRRKCHICSIVFTSNSLLGKHLASEHQIMEPFKCPSCPKTFKNSSGMYWHKMTHPEFVRYRCTVCNLRFQMLSYFQTHSQKFGHHQKPADMKDIDDLSCYKCCRKYTTYIVFDKHIRLANTMGCNAGELHPQCNQCQAKCSSIRDLRKHFVSVHGIKHRHRKRPEEGRPKKPKKEKCKVCGKMLCSDSTTMKLHMNWHEGRKDFKCDLCDYATAFPSTLRSHRKKHFGEKQFTCEICAVGFKNKHDFYVHEYTHKDVPPPKCSGCGKVYYSEFMYGYHLRMCKVWKMLPKSDTKDKEQKVLQNFREQTRLQDKSRRQKRQVFEKAEKKRQVFEKSEKKKKTTPKKSKLIIKVRQPHIKENTTVVKTELMTNSEQQASGREPVDLRKRVCKTRKIEPTQNDDDRVEMDDVIEIKWRPSQSNDNLMDNDSIEECNHSDGEEDSDWKPDTQTDEDESEEGVSDHYKPAKECDANEIDDDSNLMSTCSNDDEIQKHGSKKEVLNKKNAKEQDKINEQESLSMKTAGEGHSKKETMGIKVHIKRRTGSVRDKNTIGFSSNPNHESTDAESTATNFFEISTEVKHTAMYTTRFPFSPSSCHLTTLEDDIAEKVQICMENSCKNFCNSKPVACADKNDWVIDKVIGDRIKTCLRSVDQKGNEPKQRSIPRTGNHVDSGPSFEEHEQGCDRGAKHIADHEDAIFGDGEKKRLESNKIMPRNIKNMESSKSIFESVSVSISLEDDEEIEHDLLDDSFFDEIQFQ